MKCRGKYRSLSCTLMTSSVRRARSSSSGGSGGCSLGQRLQVQVGAAAADFGSNGIYYLGLALPLDLVIIAARAVILQHFFYTPHDRRRFRGY